MRTKNFFLIAVIALFMGAQMISAQESGMKMLDEWTDIWKTAQQTYFGYPCNQDSPMRDFYEWYVKSGIDAINLNNAGDPMTDQPSNMSTQAFEKEVIEFFTPLYGFDPKNVWGIVTHSGTDGNNHGIYFGAKYLMQKTKKRPIAYVSDEAHYSNMRLCDLQNLEIRLIKTDSMGRMIPKELEKAIDPSRPALVVYAMGSTFKGAIDDIDALNAVLAKFPKMKVYRHVDAALFGGYLPFTKYQKMVSARDRHFESIAISGHKFFGIDSPSGLFLCTRDIYDNQNDYNISYLNQNMKMINCSRDAVQPLKFWWLTKSIGHTGWTYQAAKLLAQRDYLKQQLDSIGWPNWVNDYSNTVFFRRPSQRVISKYTLAQGYDDRFGGELAHVVVMQHVTKEKIDMFIADLIEELPDGIPGARASSQKSTEKILRDGQLHIRNNDKHYAVQGQDTK